MLIISKVELPSLCSKTEVPNSCPSRAGGCAPFLALGTDDPWLVSFSPELLQVGKALWVCVWVGGSHVEVMGAREGQHGCRCLSRERLCDQPFWVLRSRSPC